MNTTRIKAIFVQEYFLFYRSVEIIFDLVVYPVMAVVVFGYLSKYLVGENYDAVGRSLLMGILLWQFIWIIQYTIPLGGLWNIWSRNLSNLFVTPLTVQEYIFAHVLSGVAKGLIILLFNSLMVAYLFDFTLLELGTIPLLLTLLNLGLFAFSMGVVILGLIFRFGMRIQAFAWGLLPFFQPVSAAFYPVSVLPKNLQLVSFALPTTYVFEAGRQVLEGRPFNAGYHVTALLLNIVYLVIAILLFRFLFKKSKESGQFARNEA